MLKSVVVEQSGFYIMGSSSEAHLIIVVISIIGRKAMNKILVVALKFYDMI